MLPVVAQWWIGNFLVIRDCQTCHNSEPFMFVLNLHSLQKHKEEMNNFFLR